MACLLFEPGLARSPGPCRTIGPAADLMRITIVNGFFLPVPPISGGATEKSWYCLGREFAARGHTVTQISRQWRSYPPSETAEGVVHVRLKGCDHTRHLWRNLVHDWFWSWRVFRALPAADIVVVNSVMLPIWLGRLKPAAGRVVVMPGRVPKGQYRFYRRLARIIAPSEFVRERVVSENPALDPLVRVCGYPINWTLIQSPATVRPSAADLRSGPDLVVGYVGRLHEEKGLLLLADAARLLGKQPGIPPWRLLVCGPSDVSRGGSGTAFRNKLVSRLSSAIPGGRFHLLNPEFNERVLAGIYRQLDVFCYPSLAAQGETFGVAIAEAMAGGAVPVVSSLPVFSGLIRSGANGLVFDHAAADAPARLAAALGRLLGDEALRRQLSLAAQEDSRRYDFPNYAEDLLADFARIIRPA